VTFEDWQYDEVLSLSLSLFSGLEILALAVIKHFKL
jgi:hypothetical protein